MVCFRQDRPIRFQISLLKETLIQISGDYNNTQVFVSSDWNFVVNGDNIADRYIILMGEVNTRESVWEKERKALLKRWDGGGMGKKG